MMYPRGHNHWRSEDFSTGGGGKARERSDQVGRECGRGGVPPPTVEKFFFLCVCILMSWGRVGYGYSGIHIIYSPLFQFYFPINGGGGGGALCPT